MDPVISYETALGIVNELHSSNPTNNQQATTTFSLNLPDLSNINFAATSRLWSTKRYILTTSLTNNTPGGVHGSITAPSVTIGSQGEASTSIFELLVVLQSVSLEHNVRDLNLVYMPTDFQPETNMVVPMGDVLLELSELDITLNGDLLFINSLTSNSAIKRTGPYCSLLDTNQLPGSNLLTHSKVLN